MVVDIFVNEVRWLHFPTMQTETTANRLHERILCLALAADS